MIDKRTAAKMAKEAYFPDNKDIDGWKVVDSSKTIKLYQKGDERVYAFRGTANFEDVKAWVPSGTNRLTNTKRYKRDLEFVNKHRDDKGFKTFGTGHSLGGAIVDEFQNQKLFDKSITFNPAVEPKYLHNKGNERHYSRKDPLYNLHGKYASNIKIDEKPRGFFEKIDAFLVPKLPSLSAHDISPFANPHQHHMDRLVA